MPAMTLITDTPQVRTLLLTDLVDSTGLVERIGDSAAAELFRAHDRIVLGLQQRWRGRLIDRSDGLLLIFERPIDGLGFALDYVRGLRELGREHKQPLQARAGLHVGEVLVWENSVDAVRVGAKSLEVEGLAKPLAGRLMAMARPGQILLSATAEPLAHRAARELGERGELLVWKSYGRWRFKGLPEGQEVYEVGEPGLAPLRMPGHTPKAWRDLPLWRRPAALAAEAMMLAAMLVGGWFIAQPKPAIAFNERDWVVVGDLRNLTGDVRLDDSLEQAFRISLEQSRYVNILSDLKVRETLENMQRKPDVAVDRAVGSEIALRDGARALILPTVSEVGGRLRVSAEVVDPHTQATVYALSSDGKGVESALDSIDNVTGELREKFGEALQSVQTTSIPLPNVGTPSLEALKAFALARNVVETTRDRRTAISLYRRALDLDPDFALVYADIASLHASLGLVDQAMEQWQKALSLPQRLTSQEKQRIQLMLEQYGPPGPYLSRVADYMALYPDDYLVLSRLGTNQWHQLNDFSLAAASFRRVLKPEYPRHGTLNYSLGIVLLGQERIAEAREAFNRSVQIGFTGAGVMHARAYDTTRDHDQADRIFSQSTGGRDGWVAEDGVVTWVDRGQWQRAEVVARDWVKRATASDQIEEAMLARGALTTVLVLTGRPGVEQMIGELVTQANPRTATPQSVIGKVEFQLLLGALSAYRNDRATLDKVLANI